MPTADRNPAEATASQRLPAFALQPKGAAMATIRAIRPFLGTLRIVWMAERDLDFIDMNVPGHFTFEAHGLGGFQFGLVQGDIDRRADDGLAFRAERRQAAATARSRK